MGDYPLGALMVATMEIHRARRATFQSDSEAAADLLDELVAAGYRIDLAPDVFPEPTP